ncbi:transposase, partial [Xanthomonas hortorum]|uniref:transposase n=1 Tax=Xanthomonas hortorum TaxID=56454 RepID=UPI001F23FA94
NGRLRDECLNEHWFPTLLHARTEIERWRREYNEDRPKKAICGRIQLRFATLLRTSSEKTSRGVLNPSILRGRL